MAANWKKPIVDWVVKGLCGGAGAAILAAFLALAGAAWYLALPDLLSFFLFTCVYWFLVYLYIYILIFLFSYERAKERVRETWLFIFMKKAFTLERQALMFFLKIGFLLSSFGLFVWSYKLMFGEVERGNLVNPLQVVAQLSCFLFHLKYPARVRHLLLLCFFLSLVSSLHLKGIDGGPFFRSSSLPYGNLFFASGLCPFNHLFGVLPRSGAGEVGVLPGFSTSRVPSTLILFGRRAVQCDP